MLILTKLQRPSVAEDFIVRPRLTERLEQGRSRKLTLISAPAGYGKSSLVSAWLASTADASVWLSIDKTDTDLTLFLSYLVTGIRAYFPEGCPSSFEILQAAEPPPFDVVAASLINDLAELATPLIIVFDDYQYIVGSDSARLIATLVQYAPHQINVVIVTRHDPNLALARLRAKHEMLEVSSEDLRFTQREVAAFLATQELPKWKIVTRSPLSTNPRLRFTTISSAPPESRESMNWPICTTLPREEHDTALDSAEELLFIVSKAPN